MSIIVFTTDIQEKCVPGSPLMGVTETITSRSGWVSVNLKYSYEAESTWLCRGTPELSWIVESGVRAMTE